MLGRAEGTSGVYSLKGKKTLKSVKLKPTELYKYKSRVFSTLKSSDKDPEPTVRISAVCLDRMHKVMRAFYEAANKRNSKRPDRAAQTQKETISTQDVEDKKPLSSYSEEDCEELGERFCMCNEPYKAGELMFKCEGFCGDWYHPRCVNMSYSETERQRNSNERWYCPKCRDKASEVMHACGTLRRDYRRKYK